MEKRTYGWIWRILVFMVLLVLLDYIIGLNFLATQELFDSSVKKIKSWMAKSKKEVEIVNCPQEIIQEKFIIWERPMFGEKIFNMATEKWADGTSLKIDGASDPFTRQPTRVVSATIAPTKSDCPQGRENLNLSLDYFYCKDALYQTNEKEYRVKLTLKPTAEFWRKKTYPYYGLYRNYTVVSVECYRPVEFGDETV